MTQTEKNYSVTVTGVCFDEKGSMYNTVAFYNGESFYSYLMAESDISSADNESKELYGKPLWFTRIIRGGAGELYVTDSDGKVHTNASGKWVKEKVSPDALSCLWISPQKTVYAAGAGGIVYARSTKGWQALSPALGHNICSIGGSGNDNLLAVGDAGLVSHFNGKEWTPVKFSPKIYFKGVCWHAQHFLLCGEHGEFFELAGANVRELISGTDHLYGITLYCDQIWLALGSQGVGRWVDGKIEVMRDTFSAFFITGFGAILGTGGMDIVVRYDGKEWKGHKYS